MDRITLPKKPRIVVTRTDALGDVILTTPVYRALKDVFAGSYLSVVCREYTEPILRNNPYIDECITVEEERSTQLPELTACLRAGAFDVAIVLFPSRFIATALRDAHIPIRVGSARRFHSWKFTHRVNHSRKRNDKSEAQYNLDMLCVLGVTTTDCTPEVYVPEQEINTARQILADNGVSSGFVVLHPGSGGSALDWPLSQFVRLADELRKRGAPVVFTGNKHEAPGIELAMRTMTARCVSLAGKTSLLELAGVLKLADAVVANSTGPLHLAAAVGTPTVGLFPRNASMSPVRWAPPVKNTVTLQPDDESEGMSIALEQVLDATLASRSNEKVSR